MIGGAMILQLTAIVILVLSNMVSLLQAVPPPYQL